MPLVRWTTDDLRVTIGTLVYLDHNPIDAFEMNNGSRPHFGHELERLALLRIVLPQIELTSKESHAALIPRFDSRNAKPLVTRPAQSSSRRSARRWPTIGIFTPRAAATSFCEYPSEIGTQSARHLPFSRAVGNSRIPKRVQVPAGAADEWS
jgi:hypothetical protein